jgi:dephospho-CoA kinase
MMHAMLRVGLTGNIASGKSNAARVFAELGACIIDADAIAHELMLPGHETYDSVTQAFGDAILNVDRTINRKALGHLIFGEQEKRLLLNSLVHPAVIAEVDKRITEAEKTNPRGIIIVDAALMVETGYYKLYDRLIVVTCTSSLQLARLVNRDELTLEQARARIMAQMPVEEKLKVAHYTIETSGTLRQTREQIEAIYRDLLMRERQAAASSQS